jgi:tetratricopeptide (TPR) repeat protein
VARRGAAHLNDAGAAKAFREAVEDETGEPWEPETWIDEGPVRADAEEAVERARRDEPRAGRASETEPDTTQLKKGLPANRRAHAERDVKKATKAFQREYFRDAEKLLKPLHAVAPDDLTVLELYGLTLYRLERWRAAAERLERFAEITGSVEQHPVIADCRRALGHHRRVAELWEELREHQASAALMAEGRIVYAGDLADQGDLRRAIAELERSSYKAKKPKDHHLRLRYALADLYERAGDVPRARELFDSIARHDADYVDVRRRIAALR